MVLFPEVQRKAQKELDEVVGSCRLPEYEDRENLPYINALCKEVLRWHPVLPLGISHSVMDDDVYGRYFIPAGSLVVGNTWYSDHHYYKFLSIFDSHHLLGHFFTMKQRTAPTPTNSSRNDFLPLA